MVVALGVFKRSHDGWGGDGISWGIFPPLTPMFPRRKPICSENKFFLLQLLTRGLTQCFDQLHYYPKVICHILVLFKYF